MTPIGVPSEPPVEPAFETVAVVDWSGGNDTGPKPRKDAIWLAVAGQGKVAEPVYLRNR